ncbi:glucan endo-1,3-beta-glucosidase 7-like [Impatiens glandulifera]|uniref:glucan endo-1,3-beta-glucosidase 7-like n=1 Tax=Impatiens glandulifera TaxID=253017 RepID=UPI001FB12BA0|nr:glucan endo-1,3-beta-glucosidase 7-like [Impatiens glandulifera]XP_047320503.1 glucan endo-1,3-beta-glucosidase 7-like [Impatiens glandulifera]
MSIPLLHHHCVRVEAGHSVKPVNDLHDHINRTTLRIGYLVSAVASFIWNPSGTLEKAGFGKTEVIVSETGWASKGDANEVGANARTYNKNLRKRLLKKKGTPYRPKRTVKGYVFSLFNENLKPGPTSERNFGLFKADGSTAYDIGFRGLVPSSGSSFKIKNFRFDGWTNMAAWAMATLFLIHFS